MTAPVLGGYDPNNIPEFGDDDDDDIDADPYCYVTAALDEDEEDNSGLSIEFEEDDDYFDPYYGDEYDRLHNNPTPCVSPFEV